MSQMKDRTKRAYLSQSVKPRMRTILDPRVNLVVRVGGAVYQRPIEMSDYISVPAIATAGAWATRDLLPPEQLQQLARFTNKLAKR